MSDILLPNDRQREALCEMMYYAFVAIRALGWEGRAEQASDLADAFHNLPQEMYGWGRWDVRVFRNSLHRYREKYTHEQRAFCNFLAMLDDIFPDPPPGQILLDAAWLTWGDGTVPRLAERIHAERSFDRLPVLADALEEAGCTNREILDHMRKPVWHGRGCWVLNTILSRCSSMADEGYIKLLQRFDDPEHWECPPSFDRQRAISRFQFFVAALEGILGSSLKTETGAHIQDASFHSQIYLPDGGILRFSNFGDMASLADEEEEIPSEARRAVLQLLADHGYVYVPPHILERSYTGPNPGVTGIHNWWIRYFDWV